MSVRVIWICFPQWAPLASEKEKMVSASKTEERERQKEKGRARRLQVTVGRAMTLSDS